MSTDSFNDFYCRVEIFCFSDVLPSGFIKEKCFAIKDDDYYNFREEYDVYAKNFFDFQSTLDYLIFINEKFNDIKYVNSSIKQCESVLIYNKWRFSPLDLSMYSSKWMLSHRSILTNEWKENLDRFGQEQETVHTRVPHYEQYDWCDFISRERVFLLIKDFLDKGDPYTYPIGDFDRKQYANYLHDFWQSWIEDDELNQPEQQIESDDNLENKRLDVNSRIEILEDEPPEKSQEITLPQEIDGQLNLFDLGLDV